MIKTMVLIPTTTTQRLPPFLKNYDYKDTIYAIDIISGETNFLPAEKITPYDHLIMAKGHICHIISITSSEKGVKIE